VRARRLDIVDQVVEDGESVVLVGHTVVKLSPLATAILAELADWTEIETVSRAMIEIFGSPPEGTDATAAIEAAILDMAGQNLLEHD
jgi:hypothetical protein